MPQLEDIEDDYDDSVNAFNSDGSLSSKSCNSKRMFTLMPNLEDIEPEKIDSSTNGKNCKSFCFIIIIVWFTMLSIITF